MLRTQITLTEEERRLLDLEGRRTGRSLSALIRNAIDQVYGDGATLDEDLAAISAGYGAWQGRTDDGAAWVHRLRSGARVEGRA